MDTLETKSYSGELKFNDVSGYDWNDMAGAIESNIDEVASDAGYQDADNITCGDLMSLLETLQCDPNNAEANAMFDRMMECSNDESTNVEEHRENEPTSLEELVNGIIDGTPDKDPKSLEKMLDNIIGDPPDIAVYNYEAYHLPRIFEGLNSSGIRGFHKIPLLLFVKRDDNSLGALACNTKEARELLHLHLENNLMKYLDDKEVEPYLASVGRENKLASAAYSNKRFSSVVCDLPSLSNLPEPLQVRVKNKTIGTSNANSKSKTKRKGTTDAKDPRFQSSVTIPNNKRDGHLYGVQMAIPVPLQLDETNFDEAVNLVCQQTGKVFRVRLVPYMMYCNFGGYQNKVEINRPREELGETIVRDCRLPCQLNEKKWTFAVPSKRFGSTPTFELGLWDDQAAFESVSKRTSIAVEHASVRKVKGNIKKDETDKLMKDESVAGWLARFLNVSYPEFVTTAVQPTTPSNRADSIVANLKLPKPITRKTRRTIKTVQETLSNVDKNSKAYVTELEAKVYSFEKACEGQQRIRDAICDEYRNIIALKDETIQRNNQQAQFLSDSFTRHGTIEANLCKQIETLEAQNKAIKNEIVEKTTKIDDLVIESKRTKEVFETSIERLTNQRDMLAKENAALKDELRAIRDKCNRLEKNYEVLHEKCKGFEASKNEMDSFLLTEKRKRKLDDEESKGARKRTTDEFRNSQVTVKS